MSLRNPETFSEKYVHGPVLRLASESAKWATELPFRAINSIISGVENAVQIAIWGKK